jgi:hypothetical protein
VEDKIRKEGLIERVFRPVDVDIILKIPISRRGGVRGIGLRTKMAC